MRLHRPGIASMQRKKIIAWCPQRASHFVVGSNDLRLYHIETPSVPSNARSLARDPHRSQLTEIGRFVVETCLSRSGSE